MTRRISLLAQIPWLFATIASPSAFASPCPRLEPKNAESVLAAQVGAAVLYPMDVERYEETMGCLFGFYLQPEFALGSLNWDVTHALWRVMAAHPSQFFTLLVSIPAQARAKWRQGFKHAALWPREACPSPDPVALARNAVVATHLQGDAEAQRREVLAAFAKLKCRVAQ